MLEASEEAVSTQLGGLQVVCPVLGLCQPFRNGIQCASLAVLDQLLCAKPLGPVKE